MAAADGRDNADADGPGATHSRCAQFSPDRTLIAVFSYGRGRHLQTCIKSLEQNAPNFTVAIFDDASTDWRTRRTLKYLAQRYEVIFSGQDQRTGRVGGLHQNMTRALDLAITGGYDFLYCIQDDQQLVRQLDSDWELHIQCIFADHLSAVEVTTLFLETHLGETYCRARFRRHCADCYFPPDPDETWGACDTGIFHIGRLRSRGLTFLRDETSTSRHFFATGAHFVCSAEPVMMFTPWPRSSRGNRRGGLSGLIRRTLIRLNEIGVHAGRARYRQMTPSDVHRLLNRGPSELPYAERYLKATTWVRRPWFYSDCFDRSQVRGRALLSGRWLFDGPTDYVERVKKYHLRETVRPVK